MEKIDVDYMKQLLKFSKAKNEPFVAMLVDSGSGEILQYGLNRYPKNPIMHSEMDAYSTYSDKMTSIEAQSNNLTLYTTACPCPMCTGALGYSKIKKVVYGVSREFLEGLGFNEFKGLASEDILKYTKDPSKISLRQIADDEIIKECEQLFKIAMDKYPVTSAAPILAKL